MNDFTFLCSCSGRKYDNGPEKFAFTLIMNNIDRKYFYYLLEDFFLIREELYVRSTQTPNVVFFFSGKLPGDKLGLDASGSN